LFNEVVLFTHGKEVSEYEHLRGARADNLPGLRIPTSIAYAGSNLVGKYQQPKKKRNK